MGHRTAAAVGCVLIVLVATALPAAADTTTAPDTAGDVGVEPSLVLDATGDPVISYYDRTNGDLKVLHCDDPDCAGTETPTTPDTTGHVGEWTSLELDANGNPVISYYDRTNGDLKVLHCDDPDCAGTETPTTPDTTGHVGEWTSLELDAKGNPVISYYAPSGGNLKVLHCDDPDCAGTETPTTPDTTGDVGVHTSLELDSTGNPVISYSGIGWDIVLDSYVVLMHCGDPYCAGPATRNPVPGSGASVDPSFVLDAAGNPVIVFGGREVSDSGLGPQASALQLKVVHCVDPDCGDDRSPTTPDTDPEVGWDAALVLDAAGNPVISYHDAAKGDLKVLHCDDAACESAPSTTSTTIPHTSKDPTTTATPTSTTVPLGPTATTAPHDALPATGSGSTAALFAAGLVVTGLMLVATPRRRPT